MKSLENLLTESTSWIRGKIAPRWKIFRVCGIMFAWPIWAIFQFLFFQDPIGRPSWDQEFCYRVSQWLQLDSARQFNFGDANLVIVGLGDELLSTNTSRAALGPSRTNYIPLLKAAKGATVFFDLSFLGNSSDTNDDFLLAEAMREHGDVVIAQYLVNVNGQFRPPPNYCEIIATNAKMRVIANFWEPPNTEIRRLPTTFGIDRFTASWWIARNRQHPVPPAETTEWLWLNYKGHRHPQFRTYSLSEATDDKSDFRVKAMGGVVFVGDFSTTGYFGHQPDQLLNNFGENMYGVEFHALALENLISNSFLTNLGRSWAIFLALAWAGFVANRSPDDKPKKYIDLIVGGVLGVLVLIYVTMARDILWNWLVPVTAPLIVGLVLVRPRPDRVSISPENPTVFVSYRSSTPGMDVEEFVLKLIGIAQDVNVWYDQIRLTVGTHWEPEVNAEIDTRDNFVFLLSKEALEDLYVQTSPVSKEVIRAWARGGDMRFLIVYVPCRASVFKIILKKPKPDWWGKEDWELLFREIQSANFGKGPIPNDLTINRLIWALKRPRDWKRQLL